MELITWLDSYSVGNERLDGQHQRLLSIINSLGEAMLAGTEHTALMKILSDLAGYAKNHFRDEERILAEHNYPHLATHQERHADLNRKLADYYRNFYLKKDLKAQEVLDFLKHWLFDHILEEDMGYKVFLADSPASPPHTI